MDNSVSRTGAAVEIAEPHAGFAEHFEEPTVYRNATGNCFSTPWCFPVHQTGQPRVAPCIFHPESDPDRNDTHETQDIL